MLEYWWLHLNQLYPPSEQRQHCTEGELCWCNPVVYSVPDSDEWVIVHTCACDTPTQDRQYLHGAN